MTYAGGLWGPTKGESPGETGAILPTRGPHSHIGAKGILDVPRTCQWSADL